MKDKPDFDTLEDTAKHQLGHGFLWIFYKIKVIKGIHKRMKQCFGCCDASL